MLTPFGKVGFLPLRDEYVYIQMPPTPSQLYIANSTNPNLREKKIEENQVIIGEVTHTFFFLIHQNGS